MKKYLILLAGLSLASSIWAKPKDPVVMTVDGRPVLRSEFEYLRHKNDGQELEPESIEDFTNRIVAYKLKIASALRERMDTLPDFRAEYAKYRRELAEPYLKDTTVVNSILEQSYKNTLKDVELEHLMVSLGHRATADSLRAAILAGADFREAARKHSTDPSLKNNDAYYGWSTAGSYPYEFEEVAWNTPVGQVSEVISTPYGYHLVKVLNTRYASGEIRASHILVPTKEAADSLLTLLQGGADFAELARNNSTCPSAQQGGDLEWFGRGQMVGEFDKAAFELKDGQVSAQPVQTRFGWHIIKRTDSRMPSKFDAMERIKAQMARDSRSQRPRMAMIEKLKKQYKTAINPKAQELLLNQVAANGMAQAMTNLAGNKTKLLSVADSVITLSDYAKNPPRLNPRVDTLSQVKELLPRMLDQMVLEYENQHLAEKHPDFRNVDREYREGLLVFAASEKNIWKVPETDPAGLEKYFQEHRANYNDWTAPRWKGYIIYATSDSLLQEVNTFLTQTKPEGEAIGASLKERFPREIRIERVILPQHNNSIVDHIAFGAPAPKLSENIRMRFYMPYQGRLINTPEEAADVRGRVSADWIDELEKEWVEQLKTQYPVKINWKEVKKVK